MSATATGLAAALATGVQVGLAMVLTRALDGAVPPVTLAALRYGIGVAVLLPIWLRARRRWAPIARGDIAS